MVNFSYFFDKISYYLLFKIVLMFCIIKKSKGDMNKMEKINILMIDDNVNLIEMIKEYFKNHADINIIMIIHIKRKM